MIVGLRPSGRSRRTAWAPAVHRRAVLAPSTVRRLTRWLEHERLEVHALDGPLRQQALTAWGNPLVSLALDTAPLWHTDGVVRLSLVYRGRAIPIGWKVLDPPSRRVSYAVDQDLLEQVAEWLPGACPVVLTADRGVADTHLMDHLGQCGGPWRLRSQGSFGGYGPGTRAGQVNRRPWSPGTALFWQHVDMTKQAYGPVPLARGRPKDPQDSWDVVSDERTASKTFEADG